MCTISSTIAFVLVQILQVWLNPDKKNQKVQMGQNETLHPGQNEILVFSFFCESSM